MLHYKRSSQRIQSLSLMKLYQERQYSNSEWWNKHKNNRIGRNCIIFIWSQHATTGDIIASIINTIIVVIIYIRFFQNLSKLSQNRLFGFFGYML